MRSYSICFFFFDLFLLAEFPLGPSMLLQMARFYSVFKAENIPLYMYTTSALPTGNNQFVFYICELISVLLYAFPLFYFLDSTYK